MSHFHRLSRPWFRSWILVQDLRLGRRMSSPADGTLPMHAPDYGADALRRLAFDHAAEAIMICDASGRIVDVNKAFTASTGYTFDEMLGRAPGEVFWEDGEARRTEIEAAL